MLRRPAAAARRPQAVRRIRRFDPDATPGELGQGGDGGFDGGDPGGGGGGGLFGGGGGTSDIDDTDGGGGGGGGSGFGPPGVTLENGVEEGDGFVAITYDPEAGGCVSPIVIEPRFTG